MFFAVAAHSEDIDADGVLDELLEQCREGLGDRVPQAGIKAAVCVARSDVGFAVRRSGKLAARAVAAQRRAVVCATAGGAI